MDVIGKVDRRCSRWKVNDVAVRGDGKNAVGEEIHFHRIKEFFMVAWFFLAAAAILNSLAHKPFLPVLELLDPRDFLGKFFSGYLRPTALLVVEPVRRP